MPDGDPDLVGLDGGEMVQDIGAELPAPTTRIFRLRVAGEIARNRRRGWATSNRSRPFQAGIVGASVTGRDHHVTRMMVAGAGCDDQPDRSGRCA